MKFKRLLAALTGFFRPRRLSAAQEAELVLETNRKRARDAEAARRAQEDRTFDRELRALIRKQRGKKT